MVHHPFKAPCRRLWRISGLVPAMLLFASASQAQTIFQSGPEQVPLLELYTSQGCSSCPPADQWLSRLKEDPGLWKNIVPLAFHVDYWDYIGWQDPFAQPEFGQRQRHIAEQGGTRAVYTPGMMLNGKDWRGWTRGDVPQRYPGETGTLTMSLDGQQLVIHYAPAEPLANNLQVYVALLGFDVKSEVTAGENTGRELRSDFIVLKMVQMPLLRDDKTYSASLPALQPDHPMPRLAIAAWVADRSALAPLQAVGGWLESPAPVAAAGGM